MSNDPTISVVIPAFNAESYIEQALVSVLQQTYPSDHLEIILIDDGSEDQTRSKAEVSLRGSAVRHQILSVPNGGPSKARNIGWTLAKGNWIQFLDADDLLAPNKVEHQASFVPIASEATAVIYSPWQNMVERPTGEWHPGNEIFSPDLRGDTLLQLLKSKNFVATGSQLFRRCWLERVQGFNERRRFIEDVELLLKITMAGGQFIKADSSAPLFFYRRHARSLSQSDSIAFMDGCVANAELAEQYWRKKEGSLSQPRVEVLTDVYSQAARVFYEDNRVKFFGMYSKLRELCPHFVPQAPRSLWLFSKIIGYPMAEAVALKSRQLKSVASRVAHALQLSLPAKSAQRNLSGFLKEFCRRRGFHPRLWLLGLTSYSRFLGYVKPQLLGASEEEYQVRRRLMVGAWSTRILRLPVGKNILAICPHPDDESIGAGGLLWAHRKLAQIHFVILSNGEDGGRLEGAPADPGPYKQKLVEVRKAELVRTAKALNVGSVQFMDFPDKGIETDTKSVQRLREILARVGPDVVLLPWFFDNHPDHRATNLLYARASSDLECLVLAFEVWSLLEPNAVFDITPHLDAKLALIRNYTSQLRTVDYLNYAAGLARARAFHTPINESRTGAVEAFIALPNRDYCDLVLSLQDQAAGGPYSGKP